MRRAVPLAALATVTVLSMPLARAADGDADGVDDTADNCPAAFNPLQADCNGDGVGDQCSATTDAVSSGGDADGVCTAVDNCPSVPNVDQRDCNHNGVGDMCEGAWANRDDDADGTCNGADACPLEAGGSCGMQAITVPWVPANPSIPHSTYSGAIHTLKGIARYGGNQYKWDFGDGSASTAWTAIADPYNLGVNHVYTGAVGQTFIATLSVRNSADPDASHVATAVYRVQIKQSGALPANGQMDPNQMDVRIDMAIDQGLWYLHTTMSRGTYGDGAAGYRQPYGYWGGVFAGVCTALDSFELHGSKPNKDYATDPYVETTQRALNYILANSEVVGGVGNQGHGNPDYNLNGGRGIRWGGNDTYQNGICGVAVASSGTPARQSMVGPGFVYGRTYKDIIQDMAEWFAYGQADGSGSEWYRGGWHYGANYASADGSTNQWPMLAIAAGEDNMAIKTPTFVRTEAPFFMNYTRHNGADFENGGWGYESPDQIVNQAKTAAGMLYNYFEGNSTAHPQVKAALGWLYRHWNTNDGCWTVGNGNSYAMYGIMKAMRKPQPNIDRIVEYNYNTGQQTANSFDWYYTPIGQSQEGLATNLIRRQQASGLWQDNVGCNANSIGAAGTTGWDVLILSKGVTTIPPQAAIANCGFTWNPTQDVTMDGSPSTHPDLNRHIVKYEWDFNYVGGTFDVDATGVLGTKAGGYAAVGSYPVALRVTDDNPIALGGPQSSIASCNIRIKDPNNCPHPSAGGPYLGTHGVSFNLDASGSSDPDGDDLTYEWDLDNDGIFGLADNNVFGAPDDAVGINPEVVFAASGIYTIAVKVTDTGFHGLDTLGPCSTIAYATVEIGNHAPVSNPGGPYVARPGQTILLSGGGSSDPDGDQLTFGWDLNNDGVFTDSILVGPQFTVPLNAVVGTVYSVCLKVSDGSLNNTKCTTVTVAHVNAPPTCSIPQPAVVAQCDRDGATVAVDGSHSADADGDPLTFAWTSNCAGGVFANPAAALTSLSFGGLTGCTATLTVSDGEASTSCSLPINITDDIDPSFVHAPGNQTVECSPNAAAEVNAWLGSATAGDECSLASVSNDFTGVAGGCGGATGSAHVTWTATDAANNTAQTEANLFVVDTTDPSVTCPAPVTLECTGRLTEVVLSAFADDSCFGALVADGPNTAQYPVGTTAVGFSSTDSCGNTGSCATQVTVTDTTDPTIACPANQTVECNADHAATGVAVPAATSSDVCGDTSVTAPAVANYALGTTTVNQTATDDNGNDASCSSTVTVVDTTAPTLNCPADVVVECNAHGQATGVDTGHATATDVCTSTTITEPGVGTWPLGTNAATHSVVDELGNATSCNNLITVRDTTAPVFDAGSLGARTVLGNCSGQPVAFALPTATDVCQSAAISCGSVAGTSTGANTVTCTATDESGNVATTTITVNVLAPIRIAFHSPLEDDNVANDVATDADVANLFKVGSTIPHQVKIYACNNTDVTASMATQVSLRLTETFRSGVGNNSTAIVPEYSGVGDAGGLLVYNGTFFKYNLNTNKTDYPAGTSANAAYFSSLITATYNVAPWIIAGQEDARLESR